MSKYVRPCQKGQTIASNSSPLHQRAGFWQTLFLSENNPKKLKIQQYFSRVIMLTMYKYTDYEP